MEGMGAVKLAEWERPQMKKAMLRIQGNESTQISHKQWKNVKPTVWIEATELEKAHNPGTSSRKTMNNLNLETNPIKG